MQAVTGGYKSPPHYTLSLRTNGIEGDSISNIGQFSASQSPQ